MGMVFAGRYLGSMLLLIAFSGVESSSSTGDFTDGAIDAVI